MTESSPTITILPRAKKCATGSQINSSGFEAFINEVFLGDKACQNGDGAQHFLSPSGLDVLISSLYLYTQLVPEPGVLPVCGPLGAV